jgi:Phage capsid family
LARHYVPRSTPGTPGQLADALSDPRAVATLFNGDAHAFGEFTAAYVAKITAKDPGIAQQLRGQAGDLYPALKAFRPRSSAIQALYRADAPAAGGTVPFGSFSAMLRDVAEAGRSPKRTTGKLTTLMNSFSTDVPSDGGFWIPEDYRSDMILASLEDAIMRPGAVVVPSRSAVLHVPALDDFNHTTSVFGGIIGYWVDESTAATESQAKFTDLAVSSDKLLTLATCSNELLADAPAFETVFVNRLLPQAVAWFEDDKFIGGTGVAEPQGITNAGCAIGVTRATGSTVKFADVIGMLTRLLPQSYGRAVWLASPDAVTQLLGDFLNFGGATTGISDPPDWLTFHDGHWRLLGLPLYPTEHVSALGTAGDLLLVDRSFYLIAERLLLQVSASPHPNFNVDKTQVKVVNRGSGRSWLNTAVSPKNGSQTVSPVVRLV